jgi:lysophospholipase L1-like esterase
MTKPALFIGDSITEGFDFNRFFPGKDFINHGYSGYSSEEVLDIMSADWFSKKPEIIFICIGTNDLARCVDIEEIAGNISMMVNNIRNNCGEDSQIYITSLFPTRHNPPRPNPVIKKANLRLHSLADLLQVRYLHLNPFFSDYNAQLRRDFTDDGLHLNEKAYQLWVDLLKQLPFLNPSQS